MKKIRGKEKLPAPFEKDHIINNSKKSFRMDILDFVKILKESPWFWCKYFYKNKGGNNKGVATRAWQNSGSQSDDLIY